MFKSMLGVASTLLITTPVYNAPLTPYEIVNESSNVLVWTNEANDEETYIQPYTAVSVSRLTGYALSVQGVSNTVKMVSVEKNNEADRFYTVDLNYVEDGYYTEFLTGDTKVTVYDAQYDGIAYIQFGNLPADPLDTKFQEWFGFTESDYQTNTTITRHALLWSGHFNLRNQPSQANKQWTQCYAFATVTRPSGAYDRNKLKLNLSLMAFRDSDYSGLVFASNQVENGDWFTTDFFFNGHYYALTLPTSPEHKEYTSLQMCGGIQNEMYFNGTVTNPNQAQMLTTKKILTPNAELSSETLNNFFDLMYKAFAVLIPFFGIVIFPGVTIGLLLMIPLFVTLIIAILKLIKK